jgi:hypothetical protein
MNSDSQSQPLAMMSISKTTKIINMKKKQKKKRRETWGHVVGL